MVALYIQEFAADPDPSERHAGAVEPMPDLLRSGFPFSEDLSALFARGGLDPKTYTHAYAWVRATDAGFALHGRRSSFRDMRDEQIAFLRRVKDVIAEGARAPSASSEDAAAEATAAHEWLDARVRELAAVNLTQGEVSVPVSDPVISAAFAGMPPRDDRAPSSRVPQWSHNGIRVPLKYRSPYGTSEVHLPSLVTVGGSFGDLAGNFALADRMRPDVSVSRDELLGLPWEFMSAVHLASRRAERHGGMVDAVRPLSLFGGVPITLGSVEALANDPLLTDDDAWPREPMVWTAEGPRSICQLKAESHAGQLVEVVRVPSPAELDGLIEEGRVSSFEPLHAAALLQLHVSLSWAATDDPVDWRCVVTKADPVPLTAALRLFPPLFFVPYTGSALLKCGDRGINTDHLFAAWLIGVAEELSRAYPGILSAIRRALARFERLGLSERAQPEAIASTVEAMTVALDRLRELDPSRALGRRDYPRSEDFV